MRAKVHFLVNGIFNTNIAGGDIHFLKLADATARAGHDLNFFGGHALKEVLTQHKIPGTVTLTDETAMGKVNQGGLGGQFAMFRDFYRRYRRTLQLLDKIGPQDVVYAVSDYWFDVLPASRSKARRKMMVLHMEAPRLGQIITASRPDVDPMRAASLHYWASQEWSLRRFVKCADKHVFYLHPLMEPRLDRLGFLPHERTLVSGFDFTAADAIPAQARIYDTVWIGRVHRQKGVDDLLATLVYLAKHIENFRALFIGNLREALLPRVKELGIGANVTFSGFVSEEEKIRLLKSSRLFLLPSRHEGSPRVVGEALICGTPVLAYDIPNIRPLFGDFVRYAPPFDLTAFQSAAEKKIQRVRSGDNYLEKMSLADFRRENSWEATQAKFLKVIEAP
ncbi:MAG TPA: glycosyltransferase [Verrucomicrobiae bacterium]|nr:glycosyltransferase [Verrucomicrobiae bacterium]